MLLAATATSVMDNETAEAFAKVLEYLVNSLGEAVENNGASVLEYVGELGSKIVAYKAGIAYIWLTLAGLILIGAIAIFIVSLVKHSEAMTWLSACCLAVAITIAIVNAYQLVECYTFQEKTIIDYVTDEYNNYN